jgi:hypothetical protein
MDVMPNTGPSNIAVADGRLKRLAEIARELDDRDLEADALAEQRRLLEARFFAACIGQFKRGKSTLLNALVGEAVLPVGVVPVTSVVTILCYADSPAAIVRFATGRSQSIPFEAIPDFVDERRNPYNRRGAAVVEVGLPSPVLRDGLCLVDTPGLGSVRGGNTEATRAFVPRVDVALIVVGPDPPVSASEFETIRETDREAGELAVILNKADQVVPESLREVLEFTRTTIASAVRRPVEHVFTVSALERARTGRPTRDWSALEAYLRGLSITARGRLVGRATDRAVARIARRLGNQLAQREDALRRPIGAIEQQVDRLRHDVAEIDRAMTELRFRFDAAEADLGSTFERQRRQFIERTTAPTRALVAWIEAHASSGRRLRSDALEEARRLATSAIQEWLDRMEPEAARLYQATTEQFIKATNAHLGRVAADAADLEIDDIPAEAGLHVSRQFFFTHLMHTTGGRPLTWLIDRWAPPPIRRAHAAKVATAYLAHLLESNSHRVENDFKDRVRESRRWLEGQTRARLLRALQGAERALEVARDKQHLSEANVSAILRRLADVRTEVAGLA